MNRSTSVIIGLALLLAAVIGYAVYLHRSPMKRLSDEKGKLAAEIEQLKKASVNSDADCSTRLDEKNRFIEELQEKKEELVETVSRIKKEKHATETEMEKLQGTITLLESGREALSLKAEDLSRRALDSTNQLEEMRKEVESGNEEIARNTQQLQTMKKQMDLIAQERDQLERIKIELESHLAECRSRMEVISHDSASKDDKIVEMEKTHQSLVSQIDRQKKEKEELERLKNGLRNQLGMTQSQIESLSVAAEAKEEQLKSKEHQLKSMEKAMAELSKQFERQIREKEIEISALEDKLNIRLMDKILFASGSADITPAGQRVLESLATELRRMDGFEIAVSGHTDNRSLGPKIKEVYHDNLGLSVARAAAVSRALRGMGVRPDNLSAAGYSMYRPVAGNDTEEGRRQNRRVEIMLAPLR